MKREESNLPFTVEQAKIELLKIYPKISVVRFNHGKIYRAVKDVHCYQNIEVLSVAENEDDAWYFAYVFYLNNTPQSTIMQSNKRLIQAQKQEERNKRNTKLQKEETKRLFAARQKYFQNSLESMLLALKAFDMINAQIIDDVIDKIWTAEHYIKDIQDFIKNYSDNSNESKLKSFEKLFENLLSLPAKDMIIDDLNIVESPYMQSLNQNDNALAAENIKEMLNEYEALHGTLALEKKLQNLLT